MRHYKIINTSKEMQNISTLCLFIDHSMNDNNLNVSVPQRERLIWINVTDKCSLLFISSTSVSGF